MEAVNDTTTTNSKLHQFWGMTTRASKLNALASTNDPVGRKRHVTSKRVGETRVYYIDLQIGRVDRETAVKHILANDVRKQFWIDHAVANGYTAEEALQVLGAVAAKTATVAVMPMGNAADKAAQG